MLRARPAVLGLCQYNVASDTRVALAIAMEHRAVPIAMSVQAVQRRGRRRKETALE